MEIYDTEEEQVAALKRWWKENGTSTIVGVAMGILLIGGWNVWQGQQQEQASNASAMYDQLLASVKSKQNESIEKISERMAAEYGSTAYSVYASLLLAKTKVEQGDLEAAKTILEQQMREAGSVELRNVARIRLVKLMLATGEYEQGLKIVSDADQASIKGFSASYDELTGDLYVELDRVGEARTAYQAALRAGAVSPLLQFKLDDITATEVVVSE